MDETGFFTVPSKVGYVVARKGMRNVALLTAQERGTLVTMALAVSAAGISIPPFYLFPRKKMQKIFMEHAGEGAVRYASSSGWMCQEMFIKFMEHFIENVQPSESN